MEYFKYFGSIITNAARRTREIKCSIVMAKEAVNKKKTFHEGTEFNFTKKPVKCHIWSIDLYGAQNWTHRNVDQKYLESFEMCCLRRMKKFSWTDRVTNEQILPRVKKERITIIQRKE